MPAYVNMLLHEYCIILTQCIEWMNHLRLSVGETALLSKLDELGDMYLEKYSAPDITSDVMLVALQNHLGPILPSQLFPRKCLLECWTILMI